MKNIFFDYTVFCRILAIIFVFSLSSELVCGQTKAEKYYKKAVLCTNNDKKQAKYYEKAAELGHAMSQLEMGVRYANGLGVPQNGAKAVEWYLKAAEQGQDLAYFFLGSLYQYGIQGVEIDYKESSKWYLKAAEQKDTVSFSCLSRVASHLYPDPKNCLQEAVKQHKEGKDVLYAALLKSAAERGEPKAQYLIGRCYCRGIGVEKDYNAAYSWLEKADKQGVDAASDELYFLCDKWSVELQNVYESYSELLDKYKKMSPGAKKQQYLKEINQKGEKMERDFAIVNGYYKKRIASLTTENPTERAETFVASKSSTKSLQQETTTKDMDSQESGKKLMQKVKEIDMKTNDIYMLLSFDNSPDSKEREKLKCERAALALQAANTGYPPAQFYYAHEILQDSILTYRFDDSSRKQKLIENKMKFYRSAAKQGYTAAQYELGKMLCTKKDSQEGLYWLREAATHDESVAEYLGDLYYKGLYNENRETIVAIDIKEAIRWYKRCKNIPTANGKIKRAELLIRANAGEKLTKDEYYIIGSTDIKWKVKAAELGHRRALYEAGKHYYYRKNYNEARKWLQKAVDEGIEGASFYLELIDEKKGNK